MLELVQRKITQNTINVIETALAKNIGIRDAAMSIAKDRITMTTKN